MAEQRAHGAEIEALRAGKAAPGSVDDLQNAKAQWLTLKTVATVAARACCNAGYPLAASQLALEPAAPIRPRSKQSQKADRKREA